MSKENVKRFVDLVRADKKLQEMMKNFQEECKDEQVDIDDAIDKIIISEAEKRRLLFTVEEYKEYVRRNFEKRELDDDSLGMVVGGVSGDVTVNNPKGDVTIIDSSVNYYYNMFFVFPSKKK